MSMLTREDREDFLHEILVFAQQNGRDPAEIQALIIAGSKLVAHDLIAQSISDMQTAFETIVEAMEGIAEAIRETIEEAEKE